MRRDIVKSVDAFQKKHRNMTTDNFHVIFFSYIVRFVLYLQFRRCVCNYSFRVLIPTFF